MVLRQYSQPANSVFSRFLQLEKYSNTVNQCVFSRPILFHVAAGTFVFVSLIACIDELIEVKVTLTMDSLVVIVTRSYGV